MILTRSDIDALPSRKRAHFVNSCVGYKSANLIGTKDEHGVSNLAVFSSVIHLGSNPPLLAFILRPRTVIRNTYDNLRSSGVFTVNHISEENYKQAHQTSAKYAPEVSEFESAGLTEEYLNDFDAPFAKESPIKIGCRYINEYYLEENECTLIIGGIEFVQFDESILNDDGWLNLEKSGTAVVSGLDAYSIPALLDRLSYAEPGSEPKSIL